MTTLGYCFFLMVFVCNTGGQLLLAPSSTVLEFVNSSITFHCYHTTHDVSNWNWFINDLRLEQSPLSASVSTIIDVPSDVSYLIIHSLTPEFNNSEIYCTAGLSTEIVESSLRAYVVLQGLLSNVIDLALSINGANLLLTWTPPFSLFGDISYVVMERRPALMTEITDVTESLHYDIGITSSFISECTDYIFYVIPENRVGSGKKTSISIVNEELLIFNYSLRQNSLQNYDIMLELSSVVCNTNVKITSHILNSDNSTQFTLNNIARNEYQYILNLSLPAGENYLLDILLMNNKNSYNQTIRTSTHSVHDIQIRIIQPGLLRVTPVYLNNSSNGMIFLCLLLCTNDNCSEIQFERSIFILIKSEMYNLTYASGYYKIFAFDVDTDGVVYTAEINTAYPAINNKMNLTYDSTTLCVPQVVEECFLQYDHNTVSTTCNPELNNRAEQQILLLPIDVNNLENNGIRVSELSELSKTLCFTSSSNGSYFALTIIVENDSASSYPFGILSLSQTGFIQEEICTPRTTMLHMMATSSEASYSTFVIIISIICVTAMVTLILIIIIYFLQWRKVWSKLEIATMEINRHTEAKLASGLEKKVNSSRTYDQLSEFRKSCSDKESKCYEVEVNVGMNRKMLETTPKKHTNDRDRCMETMPEIVFQNDAALKCIAKEEESQDDNNTAL